MENWKDASSCVYVRFGITLHVLQRYCRRNPVAKLHKKQWQAEFLLNELFYNLNFVSARYFKKYIYIVPSFSRNVIEDQTKPQDSNANTEIALRWKRLFGAAEIHFPLDLAVLHRMVNTKSFYFSVFRIWGTFFQILDSSESKKKNVMFIFFSNSTVFASELWDHFFRLIQCRLS